MTRAFRNYNYSWLRVEPNYDSSFNRPLAAALKSRISIRYRYGLELVFFSFFFFLFPEEAEGKQSTIVDHLFFFSPTGIYMYIMYL